MYRHNIIRIITSTRIIAWPKSVSAFGMLTPKPNSSVERSYGVHTGSAEKSLTRCTYRCNDGLWFYRNISSYDDCPVSYPLLMFLRRKVLNKPNFTFRLDPKIPVKEPDLSNKRNVFDSGDLVSLQEVDISQPLPDFENCEELKTANDEVKRLFSFAMARRKDVVEFQMREILNKTRRYKADDSSAEVKIARLTVKVRSLQAVLRDHPYNKQVKRILCVMIDKRNKWLRIMRMQDMKRFNWLIETLGINYRPFPLSALAQKPERIAELTRLTDEYCEKVKNDKIDAYRKKLMEQQEEFLREKAKTLEWIEEQEKKFGLSSDKTG